MCTTITKHKILSLALTQLKVVCGSVQLHLEFGSENAKSPVHELFTPIKIKPIICEAFHTEDIYQNLNYYYDVCTTVYIREKLK